MTTLTSPPARHAFGGDGGPLFFAALGGLLGGKLVCLLVSNPIPNPDPNPSPNPSQVLLAVGRDAYTHKLGLDKAGVT